MDSRIIFVLFWNDHSEVVDMTPSYLNTYTTFFGREYRDTRHPNVAKEYGVNLGSRQLFRGGHNSPYQIRPRSSSSPLPSADSVPNGVEGAAI